MTSRTGFPAGVLLVLGALATASCGDLPERVAPDGSSRRSSPAGAVVGFSASSGSHAWKGIPYAEPPVGELRWRAPRPAEPWTGTLEALASGAPCSQYASGFGGHPGPPGTKVGDEDCLTLDVWAPPFAENEVPGKGAGLPVMVWIHGGGNVVGSASLHDGGHLALEQGVVVVAINYRLGPFGWFSHKSLRPRGTNARDRSGNFGMLDQLLALRWVRDHIASFGGDPDNVTIFGESAGARNVTALLLSRPASGLFHRAIAQSGDVRTLRRGGAEHFVDSRRWPGHPNSSNEVVLRLFVADGRARDRADAKAQLLEMEREQVADYLRGQSPEKILGVYETERLEGLIDVPQLLADGYVLPPEHHVLDLIRKGKHNRVPVMLGTNRDEFKTFLIFDEDYVRWRWKAIPRLRDEERYQVVSEYLSLLWKATGADEPAAALSESQPGSVYVYRWDWDEEPSIPLVADLPSLIGAGHGLEVPFVFGHWEIGPMTSRLFNFTNRAGREELSARMRSYWGEFAHRGAPGRGRRGELPEWSAWDAAGAGSPAYMVLDTAEDGGFRMSGDTTSVEKILAAVEADPRLPTLRDRCSVYWEMANWGRGITRKQYPGVGAKGCHKYPFEDYPWPQ